MKKRVTRKSTRRAVARGTTRRPNPRYRVILDGYDWASIPAFNKVEAVKRAKEIYPDKKGKWTAELVDDEMYKNMRGGAAYEAKIRLERKKARAAERATAPPSRTRARRNGRGEETRVYNRGPLNRVELTLGAVDRRDRERKGRPVFGDWFVSKSAPGPFYDEVPTFAEANQRFQAEAARLEKLGYTLESIKNGTHIHADMIDHLDVAKVHNPDFERFIIIESEDPYIEDLIYPIDTDEQLEIAKNAMREQGIEDLPVLTGDPDYETARTNLILIAI